MQDEVDDRYLSNDTTKTSSKTLVFLVFSKKKFQTLLLPGDYLEVDEMEISASKEKTKS